MPSPPIIPLVIGNNGAWMFVRSSSAQGSCGVNGYPCRHPGVDVAGRAGTPVRAPEGGMVYFIADGASAPFVGYGPWLVMIRGDSGKFHLLAHLDPAKASLARMGARVEEGQIVGVTSSANHTHWEVRKLPKPAAGQTNFDNNEDPIGWMRGGTAASIVLLAALAGGGLWIWREHRKGRR